MGATDKWFVMMYSQDGGRVMPLLDDDDCVRLWETEAEANAVARKNPYANAFGFQAYEVGGVP